MSAIVTRLMPNDLRGSRWFPLSDESQDALKRTYHDQIQTFARAKIEPDDYIAGEMLLCNNDRDHYYSKFADRALPEIAEDLPGAPVMRSHNYETEPVGLFFAADVVERPVHGVRGKTRKWVRAKYILPNDDYGKSLAARAKLGIQRDVSIGWSCARATCSECSDHIASCEHAPGDIYDRGFCTFEFSGITRVLEGSFVWRGGQKDTIAFLPEGDQGDMAASLAGATSRFIDALSGDIDWRGLADLKRNLLAANVALGDRRDLRTLATRYLRAAGFGLMCAKPGDRGNVQRISVAKDRFETPQSAARWVKEHGFPADVRSEHAGAFEFEQFSDKDRKESRLVQLDEGVTARIMEPKEEPTRKRALKDSERLLSDLVPMQ